jgi:hypothetical protein
LRTFKLDDLFSMPTNFEEGLVRFPTLFPSFSVVVDGSTGSGDSAALKTFQDVCSRTMMLEMIVNDTSGKMAMMTGSTGPALDFGQRVKDAVKALNAACPEEHVMAGMMN